MISFKQFLVEDEQQDVVKKIADQIKKVGNPQNIEKLISQLNPADIDDLIRKLESDENVRQVLQQYRSLKLRESVLEENWLTSALGGIVNSLFGLVRSVVSSVVKVISHVLGGFSVPGNKLAYAGALLLTFGLAPTLLAAGSVPAAAATAGWSATWWGLMFFGKTVLEPVLKR